MATKEKYDLLQFAEEVVKKTLLIKEDRMFNLCHMALGFGSELLSEFQFAKCRKNNEINLKEELGDIEFFLVGWAIFENLDYSKSFDKVPNDLLMVNPEFLLATTIGDIQTIVKKELITGVQKLDGKIINMDDLQLIFEKAIFALKLLCEEFGFDQENDIRPMIARKLNVRYDGGGFDANKSVNRNTSNEVVAMGKRRRNGLYNIVPANDPVFETGVSNADTLSFEDKIKIVRGVPDADKLSFEDKIKIASGVLANNGDETNVDYEITKDYADVAKKLGGGVVIVDQKPDELKFNETNSDILFGIAVPYTQETIRKFFTAMRNHDLNGTWELSEKEKFDIVFAELIKKSKYTTEEILALNIKTYDDVVKYLNGESICDCDDNESCNKCLP